MSENIHVQKDDVIWLSLIFCSSVLAVFVTILCLSRGITIVFPHLYYLPIILAVYRYLQKGIVFSVGLTLIYLIFVYLLVPSTLINAIIRGIVFILIGAVVLVFSIRIREEKKRYFSLFDNSEAGTFIFRTDDLSVTDINPKFSSMTGYLKTELVGSSVDTIIADKSKREEILNQCRMKGVLPDFHVQLTAKDGSVLDIILSASVMPDYTIASTVVDITALKRVVEELRSAHHRVSDIINFLPDATFAIDMEGRVITWNRAIENMTGIPASEMLNKSDYEYALPFYGKRRPILIDLVLNEALQKEIKYPVFYRDAQKLIAENNVPLLADGKGAYLWFTASSLYDTEGNIIGAIESIRDLTEKKRAEEALKESEGKFRELFNNINEAVFFHEVQSDSTHGKFVEVNDIACNRLGYTREELLQMRVLDINTRTVQKGGPARVEAFKSDGLSSYDAEHVRKDGSVFPVHVNARMIEMRGRHYILSIVRDITEEREARRREEVALKQIETNLTQLSILNDQIRNPLAVITALVDFEEMETAEKILVQIHEIDEIITRLDLGWLESAKIRDYLMKHHGIIDVEEHL
ncbi:MAG: PAS domain S-box protein [Euryarchaeota archaeon]|nr:PAS domain S-box protein [Euryarchaeota archaeon]